MYQRRIKTSSNPSLIHIWYSFVISKVYQNIFDTVLIVLTMYQKWIKTVSNTSIAFDILLILSIIYQKCIKFNFDIFQLNLLYQKCIKFNFYIFQLNLVYHNFTNVSNLTSNIFQLNLVYQKCLKCNFKHFPIQLNVSKVYQI